MQIEERIDTFESHELEWMPQNLKNLFREILSWEQEMIGVYQAAAPLVQNWLRETQAGGILDLCSGAGGPGVTLLNAVNASGTGKIRLKLTDLYPATEVYARLAGEGRGLISYAAESFDATNSHVDPKFPVRTLLSAFHHFSPQFARKILADAVKNSNGICIMDPFQRDWAHLFAVSFGAAAGSLVYPLLKQRTPLAFAACNLSPVMGSMFLWDGFASVLRGYTPDELLQLTQVPECAEFTWEAGTWQYPAGLPVGGMTGVYLIGKRR
ncbi:MAG: hypothetical protein U1F27_17240 [Turneriella sp.]